jgi:DNA invertase Pin-like site-specific DNA recombinase
VEAYTRPRAGGNPAHHLARRGQAQGFDSPPHIARPARHTGDIARGTTHNRVQIHDGEGGTGALRVRSGVHDAGTAGAVRRRRPSLVPSWRRLPVTSAAPYSAGLCNWRPWRTCVSMPLNHRTTGGKASWPQILGLRPTALATRAMLATVDDMPNTPMPTRESSIRTVSDQTRNDQLTSWADRRLQPNRRSSRHKSGAEVVGVRFAFYGRMSTEDFQDEASSRAWQRQAASELVAWYGRIVADYFDVGYSRRVAWADRPRAAALLAALADSDRGFDAVVVGEYERAFHGSQLVELGTLLDRHGVQLWLPETGGRFDAHGPSHQALVMLLGVQSAREIQRSRFRTMAAMQAQVREQGRYLGGRPPYGYRLVDAGPHPNAAHARWGRRLQRLKPDPATASYVQWIFTQRLAGHSVASIARALNERGVPCPSGVDPDRNRHRSGTGWTLRTVAAVGRARLTRTVDGSAGR